MPATRRSVYGRKFTRARTAAEALSLDELRQLDDWLHDRIATAAADEKKKPRRASRIIVEERKTPTGTYQLELVKCGKPACKVCKGGPAHGPYWYVYWKEDGRTRSKYIGKELKPGE
jgi:hypothetical protein